MIDTTRMIGREGGRERSNKRETRTSAVGGRERDKEHEEELEREVGRS